MIKPAKYEIAYAGLPVGQSVMEFDFDSSLFVDCAESGVEAGSGKITLDITKHASMLEVTATIVGQVEVECDRCADIYTQPIDYKGSVIVKISEEQGEYDGDIIWVDPRSTSVDMTLWIYESIILSLPMQRVHPLVEQCNTESLKYIKTE